MRDPMHADAQSLWLHNSGPTTSSTQSDTTSSGATPRGGAPPSPVLGHNMSPTTAHSISKVPFVLGANKCDVDQSERQVSVEEGLKLSDAFNCTYMEVSSLKKIQTVEELFRELIKTIDRSKKNQILQHQKSTSRERTNSSFKLKVGELLPKSVSESDNADANYIEMMKQRKRQQSIRNTIGGNSAPTTSGTGVHVSPTSDQIGSAPDSARH